MKKSSSVTSGRFMKKTEIKKLDTLWSAIIRGGGKCEVCGKIGLLNAHHIIGRRNYNLRWDVRNGVCLCPGCHTFSNRSAHQDPERFHDWLEENRPEDIEYLRTERNKVNKLTFEEASEQLENN